MIHDVHTWLKIGIAVAFAINTVSMYPWVGNAFSRLRLPRMSKPAATRTPGEVLDCLRGDMTWLLANTAATEADVAPVEALAKFLIHSTKPGAVA